MMQTLYRFLLRLYPAHIRAEFGDEMTEVFAEACAAEKRRGGASHR